MIRSRGFALITGADFIVRSAYQMGKTPLLPIYAAALGAGDIFLGFIVAVSTLTGVVFKPFVGILSDRWGRRVWLLVGTAIFAGAPFIYRFVQTPEQLLAMRLLHGTATAIYGPVTLAYVAELSRLGRAERLGWFSTARNAGYVLGPLAAGWMLLSMDPVAVFTVIGALSCLAFVPILLLRETTSPLLRPRISIVRQAVSALSSGARTPTIWLAGGLDSTVLIALYAARAFLPIYAFSAGASLLSVGGFFALQHAVHIVLVPLGGRVSDRAGHLGTIGLGMAVLGTAITLVSAAPAGLALVAPAILMGVGQALVFPSTTALVSDRVDPRNLGLGMGLLGTLKNGGKVAGPVLAGFLIYWLDYTAMFRVLGMLLMAGAAMALLSVRYSRKPAGGKSTVPA